MLIPAAANNFSTECNNNKFYAREKDGGARISLFRYTSFGSTLSLPLSTDSNGSVAWTTVSWWPKHRCCTFAHRKCSKHKVRCTDHAHNNRPPGTVGANNLVSPRLSSPRHPPRVFRVSTCCFLCYGPSSKLCEPKSVALFVSFRSMSRAHFSVYLPLVMQLT